MKVHLTERLVKNAEEEKGKDVLIYDDAISGFALCIYSSGRKSFVVQYRLNRRLRRMTIGRWPEWSVAEAREEARRIKQEVNRGNDPLGKRQEERGAPTVGEMIDRYILEYVPRLAKRNGDDQISMLRKLVEPEWKHRKVEEIEPYDVELLLAKIAQGRRRPCRNPDVKRSSPLRPTPIRANRVGEVLRKMFNLAIVRWKMRSDNPAANFTRRVENSRERFLSKNELARLTEVLDHHGSDRAADVIRMLLLTGARLGEVLSSQFTHFDLEHAIWTKPAATTKQRRMHRIPLSSTTVALVCKRKELVPPGCPWLFPGFTADQPLQDIRKFWYSVREEAGIHDVRIHDLRHTYASLLVSGGMSLPMIGRLLGHTQSQTTMRYAHLMDDPLREGVEAVSNMLRQKPKLVSSKEGA